MLVSAHVGSHLGKLLVLRLLRAVRVRHVAALAKLLKVFLQPQLGIGQVLLLLLLLRRWCSVLVDVGTRTSAHLRVGVSVGGHAGAHCTAGA